MYNKLKTYVAISCCCSLFSFSLLPAQTIAEKKAGISSDIQEMTPEMQNTLNEVNKQLKVIQEQLRIAYAQAQKLFAQNAPPEEYQHLLEHINKLRRQTLALESSWRESVVNGGQSEIYALWHQPETTIGQLILDYGSQDYLYIIPDEIIDIKLSVDSNIPIPRASWEEILDLLLVQNGIGYQQLNPYVRQLYFLKDNKSGLKLITNKRRDLEYFSPDTRIAFMLTPEPAEVKRTWLFLEKFVNPKSTVLQMVGRDVLIIGQIAEVQDLLKLYDFISVNKGDKEYKVFPISRIEADEMAKILAAIFDQTGNSPSSGPSKTVVDVKDRNSKGPQPFSPPSPSSDNTETNGLRVIPLSHVARALFLVGTKEEIKKAEQIIRQVESQVGEAREKVVYWYTAKHSDPEEMAEVLFKIYSLLVKTNATVEEKKEGKQVIKDANGDISAIIMPEVPSATQVADEIIQKQIDLLPSALYQTSYYQQGNYVVNPAPVEPKKTKAPDYNKNRDNFIVDPKTGMIAMVVEANLLPKIKELAKKLDVAKRMVQIEVLLFERRINKQNNFGLNLLRIGGCAKAEPSCVTFNTIPGVEGILDYFISHAKSSILPAYNILYRFLMTQDDIQINASPSVIAVNQTPATIAIVEELSINTGIYNVETAKGNTLEKAYTRAQYGITINITPTIHITEEGDEPVDEPNYVSLDTDVTFDTIEPGVNAQQPDVFRRHIVNQASVPDGQTVILGGLRRKTTDDFKDSIPFLGELPAIGKFFSMRELQDRETEMFIFITPTIISNPLDDFERIKCDEMKRRPGDIPEFLCCLVAAREMEKNRLLLNSMDLLLGPEPDRCYSPDYWRPSSCCDCSPKWFTEYLPLSEEYDGR